jgi:hypothetical protein
VRCRGTHRPARNRCPRDAPGRTAAWTMPRPGEAPFRRSSYRSCPRAPAFRRALGAVANTPSIRTAPIPLGRGDGSGRSVRGRRPPRHGPLFQPGHGVRARFRPSCPEETRT